MALDAGLRGDDGVERRPSRVFSAVLLAALLAAPAAAEPPEADPLEQVRAALYHALMADIMKTGVETATDGAGWSIGAVNPYPSLAGDKVIAACINWEDTSLDAVDWYGYAYYYDRAQTWPHGDPVQLDKLEARAAEHCRQYEATSDCFCQTVDRNGRNALRLPEWFVRSRLPGSAGR